MLPDEINIKIETEPEVAVYVDESSDAKVIVDSPPEIEIFVPLNELNVLVETNEVEVRVGDELSTIDVGIVSTPDVIVLPGTGAPGPPGAQGPPGPEGPEGPMGIEQTYIFTQLVGDVLWDILHNLNRYPSVTVVDSGGSEIIPTVVYIGSNQVQLHFSNPTSGKAYLN